MHFRGIRSSIWLALACTAALALPASALGATPPSLTGPTSVPEGAGKATYTVDCGDTAPVPGTNTGPLTITVTDGPAPAATAGADYGEPTPPPPYACTVAADSFTVEVPITQDAVDEQDEQFTVTVSGVLAPSGQFNQAIVTKIADDDPVASITPLVRVLEGDTGASTAEVTITLSQPPIARTTIAYATEASSAIAGSDFTATTGTAVFQPGETTKTVAVPVRGDTAPEKVEAFYVNLISTDNGLLHATQKQAAVAIFDNDKAPVPTLSLPRGVAVREGARGTVNALFTVTLSSAAAERVQVAWKTANFTATLADYAAGSGTLVFEPGQTAKTISVNVKGDLRDEPHEAFVVVLSKPVGATLAAPKSFGIITDDDGPAMTIGRPKLRPRALVVALACPPSADLCRGRLSATAGRLKFGAASFEIAKGTTGKVRLKLSRKARAALRKRSRRVTFNLVAADRSGAERLSARTFRVRRLR